jgi:hypothetical protein
MTRSFADHAPINFASHRRDFGAPEVPKVQGLDDFACTAFPRSYPILRAGSWPTNANRAGFFCQLKGVPHGQSLKPARDVSIRVRSSQRETAMLQASVLLGVVNTRPSNLEIGSKNPIYLFGSAIRALGTTEQLGRLTTTHPIGRCLRRNRWASKAWSRRWTGWPNSLATSPGMKRRSAPHSCSIPPSRHWYCATGCRRCHSR